MRRFSGMQTKPSVLERKISEIEELVVQRKRSIAQRKIFELLKKHKNDDDLILLSAEWFRRLNLAEKGIRILQNEAARGRPKESFVRARSFKLSQLLNHIGASHNALRVLQSLAAETEAELQIQSEVYLTNGRYEDALATFQKLATLPHNTHTYQSRLAQITFADCLAGAGQYKGALQKVDEVYHSSSESLLRGIALQAKGEYLARMGEIQTAHRVLLEAKKYFSKDEETVDKALLNKWLGFTFAKTGREAKGRHHIALAEQVLGRPSLRIEAWLEILKLKAQLGWLSDNEKISLASYPGMSKRFEREVLRTLDSKQTSREKSHHEWIGRRKSRILIFLNQGEYVIKGQRHFGLPLELKLLAYARMTSFWGLDLVRAKSLLWPDANFEFDLLHNRLFQLMSRLKQLYGVTLRVQRSRLYFPRTFNSQVSISLAAGCPSILSDRPSFSRKEFCNFYHLAESRGRAILADWCEKNLIRKVGAARAIKYERVTERAVSIQL